MGKRYISAEISKFVLHNECLGAVPLFALLAEIAEDGKRNDSILRSQEL
jgi:hypothetical protein